MKDLSISRIILFAVVLLLMHVLIGLLIPSFEDYKEPGIRTFWLVTGYFLQAVAQVTIFMRLARVQAMLLYVHVICVFALCELLDFAVLLTFIERASSLTFMEIVFDYSVLAVWTIIGTEIGRRLRVAAEKTELTGAIRRN